MIVVTFNKNKFNKKLHELILPNYLPPASDRLQVLHTSVQCHSLVCEATASEQSHPKRLPSHPKECQSTCNCTNHTTKPRESTQNHAKACKSVKLFKYGNRTTIPMFRTNFPIFSQQQKSLLHILRKWGWGRLCVCKSSSMDSCQKMILIYCQSKVRNNAKKIIKKTIMFCK